MATIHKLTKDGATIFPATITDAVVHPQTGKTLTSMMKDYNVSELFPTEGVDGGNKYNLALAIQVLGTHLTSAQKTGGIKLTFISSVSPYPEEEYYLSKSTWSATASDWDQRFEVGDVVADPSGSWEPSTAQQYIDGKVAVLNTSIASETLARQTGDRNLQTNLTSEMNTRASQDANLNALINAGIREGGGVEFDIVPTQNSANGITSGGMYNTLRDSNVGFVDDEPIAGSPNLVKSGGTNSAIESVGMWIDFSTLQEYSATIGSSSWYPEGGKHIVIPVKPGMQIHYHQRAGTVGCLAFIKTYNFNKDMTGSDIPDYSSQEGYDSRKVVTNNSSADFTVPSDVKYVAMNSHLADTLVLPDILTIDGYDMPTTLYDKIVTINKEESDNYISNETNSSFIKSLGDIDKRKGFIAATTWYNVDNDSYRHWVIDVKAGDSVEVLMETGVLAIAVMKTYSAVKKEGQAIDFSNAEGFTERIVVSGSTSTHEAHFTVPSDAKFIACTCQSGGSLFYPTSFKINGYELVTSLEEKLDALHDNLVMLRDGLQYLSQENGQITSNGTWLWENDGVIYKHIVIPVNPGDHISFKAGIIATLGFMKTYTPNPADGSAVDFSNATGYNSRIVVSSGTSQDFVVPTDTHYVSVTTKINNQGSFYPASMKINGYELVTSLSSKFGTESDDTRNAINRQLYLQRISKLANDIQYPDADINVFMQYGQSLAAVAESVDSFTTENVGGNVKPTSDTGCFWNIFPSGHPLMGFSDSGEQGFYTLINGRTNQYEPAVVTAVNRLKVEMDKASFGFTDSKKMCAAIVAQGGCVIEQLSKNWNMGLVTVGGVGYNYYTGCLLPAFRDIKAKADAHNKNVVCPAIIYQQGETNSSEWWGPNPDGTTPYNNDGSVKPTKDKDEYKAYLLALKNDIQADVMSIFGQAKKPLFICHVPSQWHMRSFNPSVQMAFTEFMEENDDVLIAAATYPSPDYGSHLTSNGYRLLGEMFGKRLTQAYVEGKKYYPLLANNVEIVGNNIIVNIPTLYDLVFDTKTVKSQSTAGFQVMMNGSTVSISSVEVGKTYVKITCGSTLTGTVEVAYANNEGYSTSQAQQDPTIKALMGHGNIRNSDPYDSMYIWDTDSNISNAGNPITYVPLDSEGVSLEGSGKPYHCYDWLLPFYFAVTV